MLSIIVNCLYSCFYFVSVPWAPSRVDMCTLQIFSIIIIIIIIIILAWRSGITLWGSHITPDTSRATTAVILFDFASDDGHPCANISSNIWMAEVRTRVVQRSFVREPQSMSVDIWHNVFNEIPWLVRPEPVSILDRIKTGDQSNTVYAYIYFIFTFVLHLFCLLVYLSVLFYTH